MLEKAKNLKGFALEALDGRIGTVAEFYFDDRHWTVRYLVADTGTWLDERQILVSPLAIGSVNWLDKTISVNQTLGQIEDGPALQTHMPISRHFEESYHDFHGLPSYWDGSLAWGDHLDVASAREQLDRIRKVEDTWDHHLRSSKEVAGYDLLATDGAIGHLEDFILEDASWTFRYLVVDTRNWWPGKKVLISPRWIDEIRWLEKKVVVLMTRNDIRTSPEYSESALLEREYEARLHRHYARDGYWETDHALALTIYEE